MPKKSDDPDESMLKLIREKYPSWAFSKEDFLVGTAPYEEVYKFHKDPFKHRQAKECMLLLAKSVGYTSFPTEYAAYTKSLNQKFIYLENTTDFPKGLKGLDQQLNAGSWTANENGVSRISGGNTELACPHPILPIERLVNVDTGEQKLKLAYFTGGKWRYLIADKAVLASASKVPELAGRGIAVTSQTAKHFVDYIAEIEHLNEETIPERKSIGRFGYIEGVGFSPFVEDLQFDGDYQYRELFESVHEHGDYEAWKAAASEARNMSPTAKIVLAASFASVLVEPLGALPFFVHLWGVDSGTGKTVALMVAASVWGDPHSGKYLKSFDATQVGLEKTIAFLNHLPLCLDELQLTKDSHGRSSFDVYRLAQGAGRTRGNKSGGVDATPRWANCTITTGESPITSEASGAGAVNRVLDIECKADCLVIKDGMRVSRAVKENYGFAGKKFVEYFYGDQEARQAAKTRYEEVFRELSDSGTTEKQAMAAAVIIVADEIACSQIFDCKEEPLTPKDFEDFLQSKAAVSAGERGYEYLCDWVSQNAPKFTDTATEVYGRVDETSNQAYIIRKVFNQALEDGGFSGKAILSYLKHKGLIETRGKAFTKSYRINGVRTECVCLRLPVGGEDDGEIDIL